MVPRGWSEAFWPQWEQKSPDWGRQKESIWILNRAEILEGKSSERLRSTIN